MELAGSPRSSPSDRRWTRSPPRTWIPFGEGMRRRLGAEMALAEMEIVSSEVVAAFALEPAAGHAERARLAGTVLGPGRGGTVVLSRRTTAIG